MIFTISPWLTALVEEHEEEAPPETDDGWLDVGKKNRTVVTRTVCSCLSIFGPSMLNADWVRYPSNAGARNERPAELSE
ncbi:hypothetical protein R3P38DRAFT_2918473 [Favolaschia claudopus]|uniref:Uncharacterized protein n=1 Tax=Favolaschia claudopus TaxID=2862362 RepID=A0AAW0C0G0_9AGAR